MCKQLHERNCKCKNPQQARGPQLPEDCIRQDGYKMGTWSQSQGSDPDPFNWRQWHKELNHPIGWNESKTRSSNSGPRWNRRGTCWLKEDLILCHRDISLIVCDIVVEVIPQIGVTLPVIGSSPVTLKVKGWIKDRVTFSLGHRSIKGITPVITVPSRAQGGSGRFSYPQETQSYIHITRVKTGVSNLS